MNKENQTTGRKVILRGGRVEKIKELNCDLDCIRTPTLALDITTPTRWPSRLTICTPSMLSWQTNLSSPIALLLPIRQKASDVPFSTKPTGDNWVRLNGKISMVDSVLAWACEVRGLIL